MKSIRMQGKRLKNSAELTKQTEVNIEIKKMIKWMDQKSHCNYISEPEID